MSSYSRQQLESWLKTISVRGRVIGIGDSQNPTKGRTKTWNVSEYKILDLEQPHETKQYPDIIYDIQEEIINSGIRNSFDIAFCTEVAEYWFNPLQALKNINYMLKDGGKLYISFHTIYPVHNPENEDCLRYTRAGIKKLLEQAGFSIEKIIPRYFHQSHNAVALFESEGMRGLNRNRGEIHKEQGYCVECVKF